MSVNQPSDKTHVPATSFGLDSHSDSDSFVLTGDEAPEFVEATSRYRVENELGRGGTGIVFRATELELDRTVAIKVLRPELRGRRDLVERFAVEARIICHLLHPGVPSVRDFGNSADGRPFLAMRLVEGRNMLQLVEQRTDGDDRRVSAISAFADVCQTMAYAHWRNVVHLDLKLANFMVGEFGEVHVMDWGTARFLEKDGTYEAAGLKDRKKDRSRLVGGTLEYMPPEQALGGMLDKRTDVFALGACLCHILTGFPPWEGRTREEVYDRVVRGDLRPVHNDLRRCGADKQLVRIARRCLQSDPDLRPRDAGEVAAELSSWQEAALRQFHSDMSRFFELSSDLYCTAGLDGYFRRVNSNFTDVLGYDEQDLLARPFMQLVHPDDHRKTGEAMQELIAGNPITRFQNRYRTADGKWITLEWTAKSIPEENIIFAVAKPVF